ncbi:MAG: dockerin type I repeat-containing protein, partial [Oscillospiraceae bacterium]|nr:dockerin type I repeat-containing protein [Oscillospiraceae bacterium]
YQWLHDGEIIDGATGTELSLENVSYDSKGTYSVKITSESGTVREAEICNITEIYSFGLKGDVNGDGTVNISDAVLLQKYLIKLAESSEIVGENSDINDDLNVNVFDLIMLKRILIV